MTADDKVNILMVDDQLPKLLSYEVILEDLGENLIKARSANEALSFLLKNNEVAVVLMDVSMPEVDGFELAEVIRQHPRYQKTAIIFISGVHLTDSDRILGYSRGAVDYISVPVVPEVLRAKISVFVELYRKTRMLEALNKDLEKRVEDRTAKLRQSEAEFRMRAELLNLASEAIMVRAMDGDALQFWNTGAENLFGWRRDEVIGLDMHKLLQTVFPVSRTEIDRALREHKLWEGNLIQKTKNGSTIIVAYRKTVNEESNAVLEVGRDITAQLRAEEALRETEKLAAMGRLASIIAHEINNPLAAITNIFYLLREHPSLSEEARSLAELAEQELLRVSHITRQTLSFYRESKHPISIYLPDLLDSVLELQQRAFSASSITVRKKYSPVPWINGFPVELRQVFLNLIGNAIQAMPNGGTLGIYVRETMDWMRNERGVMISIIDTGIGIQPEDADRLFQPFFSTKSTKGTGLGLWISKGIIQKYDGRISCKSYRRGERCFTCFRVFLPRATMSPQNKMPSEETAKIDYAVTTSTRL
ncbi:ATP-binding protein [Acidicapsa dinghuensis]|uniref:histidine kinase n=1 Tax=Acidicapsa dinghuensis TaxID=2218256 RepID=A0ABW1EC42_9BACT|nr:hybrid sensor histidine kinase/response regulator [Acidicapsa dinghuensis]